MLKPGGSREGGTRLKAELGIQKLLTKIQVRGKMVTWTWVVMVEILGGQILDVF